MCKEKVANRYFSFVSKSCLYENVAFCFVSFLFYVLRRAPRCLPV